MRIHSKPADFRIWVLNMKKERRLLRLWDARFLPYELCIAASLSATAMLISFFCLFSFLLSFFFFQRELLGSKRSVMDVATNDWSVPATLIGRFMWIT